MRRAGLILMLGDHTASESTCIARVVVGPVNCAWIFAFSRSSDHCAGFVVDSLGIHSQAKAVLLMLGCQLFHLTRDQNASSLHPFQTLCSLCSITTGLDCRQTCLCAHCAVLTAVLHCCIGTAVPCRSTCTYTRQSTDVDL